MTENECDSNASVWGDIQSRNLLYAKGWLFVLLGLLATVILLVRHPHWDVALLLAVCVWSSCRAYYFAFYVIEHYIDDGQRYAGLIDFFRRRNK